tara:strand:+ start:149 stop:448 length:300 start_codon:yes stop_codon:yes gene_type:complete
MRWPGAASPHLSTFVFFVGNFWVEAKNGEMPLTLHLAPEFTRFHLLFFIEPSSESRAIASGAKFWIDMSAFHEEGTLFDNFFWVSPIAAIFFALHNVLI